MKLNPQAPVNQQVVQPATPTLQIQPQQPGSYVEKPPQQQQQQQQQQQRTNPFQQLSQCIEACHNASPLYKSNVRYLIDNIQNDLNGAPLE